MIVIIGVELVKPIVFQPVDRRTVGSDIFTRLVPMSAYEAASVYRYNNIVVVIVVVCCCYCCCYYCYCCCYCCCFIVKKRLKYYDQ